MRSGAWIFFLLCIFTVKANAQQFALYHTGTLFDAFENPSQEAFQTDSSRQYASNFFVPSGGANYGINGPGLPAIRTAMYTGRYNTSELSAEDTKLNKTLVAENHYILMFRLFKTVKYHRELGVSWQVKTEGYGETTNQALIVINNYQRVADAVESNGELNRKLFATDIYAQSYHQFALTYRENYNKRLAFGFKLSYLSGIAYSRLQVNSSRLSIDPETDLYTVYLDTDLRTSFHYDNPERKMVIPGVKNPGAALGLSANYRLKQGWYVMGNIKDIGFIRWSKDSYRYRNTNYSIRADSIRDSIWRDIKKSLRPAGYTTFINGKAEVFLNKDLGDYQPGLLLSKNLFYTGGDIALINTYRYRSLNASLSADYNLNGFFQVGAQLMIKSPNAEFFIGSDQLLKTYDSVRAFATSDETIGSGYNGASVYFGFALKFGRVISRQQNENYIPGINYDSERKGFLNRLLGARD